MAKSSSLRSTHAASPTRLGYRLPAEWEPHAATWLSWPHNEQTWLCGLEPVREFFLRLVQAIVPLEAVHINVNDEAMEAVAREVLRPLDSSGEIQFHRLPTNDAWCRDHGAVMVTCDNDAASYPARVAVDWGFNAWGGKYPPYDRDNAVPGGMARALGIPCVAGGMVLEGGSIDGNGAGVLLTTESCLLNPNRNPELNREHIERRLMRMLGVEQILWLEHGVAGDDTDGHIDNLARFVGRRKVVAVVADDPTDVNYGPLRENLKRLRSMRFRDGHELQVESLPLPQPVYFGSQRLPASYANFYIINRAVLVPLFEQDSDRVACETMARLFPDRQILGLDCRDVVSGLGAIHCLTQQVPLAR